MKALVTGATGLVGSALVRHLIESGDEVRVLRRASSRLDLLAGLTDRIEHHLGDVRDPESVHAAMAGVDEVYHAAAYLGFGGRRDMDLLHDVNVTGTAQVVNAALRLDIRRLVLTSSMAAFGRPADPTLMIDESLEWHESKETTGYARTKHLAELEVQRGIAEGLDAVIVNPALVFGPGRSEENTGRLVDAVRRRRMPAYPRGATCVVDVVDVASGHRQAMRIGRTGERYFLGGENLSWREIFALLADALGVQPPGRPVSPSLALAGATVVELTARLLGMNPRLTREAVRTSGHIYRYSNRKAVEELGLQFRPFAETARRIAAA